MNPDSERVSGQCLFFLLLDWESRENKKFVEFYSMNRRFKKNEFFYWRPLSLCHVRFDSSNKYVNTCKRKQIFLFWMFSCERSIQRDVEKQAVSVLIFSFTFHDFLGNTFDCNTFSATNIYIRLVDSYFHCLLL